MNKYLILLFLLGLQASVHGKPFRTEAYVNHIRSIQVHPIGNRQAPPVIVDGENRQIEIKFDEMSHEYKNLYYTLIHCNADWNPSILTPIEYIYGFREMQIEDYLVSFNTTMSYTHYRIMFPNENTRFKVSGNYAVQVFDSDRPDKPLLSACFSICEANVMPVSVKISTATDIDFNKAHQQVGFTLNAGNYRITSPQQELKIFVLQNNRTDNMVKNLRPATIAGTQYIYDHNRELIFEAGNEYRRFEMTTTAYKGMGIERLDFHEPYFHVSLFEDTPRAGKSYIYDEDQNGRYLVRAVNAENQDSEADYFFVQFALSAPEPFPGRVFIQSEAFNNILDARSEMQYNREKKIYEKTALLKQGAYNYMYLLTEGLSAKGTTAPIEGNCFETKNEYRILVYYRAVGERFDRLVGIY
ncbi:MAG: DUF5103 domain-containing protein [Dysgonamonadaceae bacterium]|jgi:hypothetical protein|nr:DUF5103 domain-containing protein [Dysgonamonadaceae bacterium]